MRIEHLREFRILASTLSFTEAARKSFVSQSVLSKHISAMEKELGHKLVTRSRAGVSLTPEGEVFKTGIESTLESYSRAVHNLEEFSQRKNGHLTIGYVRDAALPLLAPALAWLRQRHPLIQVGLKSLAQGTIASALREGRVDAAITFDGTDLDRGDCVVHPLYADHLVVALPGDHELAMCGEIGAQDLAQEHILVPDETVWPSMRRRIGGVLGDIGLYDTETIQDAETLFVLIGSGDGVAIVASHNAYVKFPHVVFRKLIVDENEKFCVSVQWLKTAEEDETKVQCLICLLRALLVAADELAQTVYEAGRSA